MFIERRPQNPPAPFGGAELKLKGTVQRQFRSSERRAGRDDWVVYKHLTPNGVKNQEQ